jgi:hypothetical protein
MLGTQAVVPVTDTLAQALEEGGLGLRVACSICKGGCSVGHGATFRRLMNS